MARLVAVLAGGLLFAIGLLWTLQGLGYVGGSSMQGDDQWALIGPAVAGLGLALAWVAVSRRGS